MFTFDFFIDRGGTFTDIYAEFVDGRDASLNHKILKLLSVDPPSYDDAPREGIRRILASVTGEALSKTKFSARGPSYHIKSIRMGTTIATNALLERKGLKCALAITKGFGDLLEIGYQNRPKIFDLKIRKPEQLYSAVIEIDERICVKVGKTKILRQIDLLKLRSDLHRLLDQGFSSLAVLCLHSYVFPDHERQVAKLASELGFKQISLSSEIMPMIKAVPRGDTAVIDAYLSPLIKNYIDEFKRGFEDELKDTQLLFMKSDAGLSDADDFIGSKAILSGPAGGVVAYAKTIYEQLKQPVIGFDMGGTSTDVSRFAGDYEITYLSELAGLRIQSPQLDIVTVAAGGGSRLFFNNGMLLVGPESSGADPGPVCYRKNGYLSITDANLVLGRLIPGYFPKIFGPDANQPLDLFAARKAFESLAAEISKETSIIMSAEQLAQGFIDLANESMARPIREVSVMKGHDIKDHVLACFGGAAAQHACAIARKLGIKKIFVHRYSGILSAYGMGLADLIIEKQSAALDIKYNQDSLSFLNSELGRLKIQCGEDLARQGFIPDTIKYSCYLNMRFAGTGTAFMLAEPPDGDYEKAFRLKHKQEFGFDLGHTDILVDDLRVRASGSLSLITRKLLDKRVPANISPKAFTEVYFKDTWVQTPVWILEDLVNKAAGQLLKGPAILMQDTATIVLEPDSSAEITDYGDLIITVASDKVSQKISKDTADPVQLAIFSNLFMSIAEQMGRTLEHTAVSTNIKERCDFSCAIFDAGGALIANAPHQPVHLGAMSETVRMQMRFWDKDIHPGDVLMTNHPQMGGSHLPDITVITPFFDADNQIIFFVANRGHHADIGGISPGSMPAFSTKLEEEGIAVKSFKIASKTGFHEQELRKLLKQSRTLEDNISDLKAQIAANQKGINLIQEMLEHYTLPLVQAYMNFIQINAENAVRKLLTTISFQAGKKLSAEDFLDDGSIIRLTVDIDPDKGAAVFDFSGTAAELNSTRLTQSTHRTTALGLGQGVCGGAAGVYSIVNEDSERVNNAEISQVRSSCSNLNAPKAVTSSAVLYVLRCLIDKEIPLNQGCLKPIEIILPENSLLAPSDTAAVVGGNVETSQRIVDVIFKAFKAVAASQGTMNNLSFGNDNFGYYETIGGGAGAGPHWQGASGVHTHMTNTKITDPEILETRYPVMLHEFSIRRGSGAKGEYNGGDGLTRVLEFLDDLTVSILSERRVYRPYGLNGGEAGAKGENLLKRKTSNQFENIPGKARIEVQSGDILKILSPGGGAYGMLRPTKHPKVF
jgi:5-oxoprolinase (ATP-hydrolysing)